MPTEAYSPATRWKVQPRQPQEEAALCADLGIGPLLAAVLVARGQTDREEVQRYLKADLADLHPPELLPDYRPAVDAILGARERKETIYVHGDYDVDGITSATLFTRFLRKLGCNVEVHVPHRLRDGYGLQMEAVREAARRGAKLLLTCDCGTGACEQTLLAHELGMKVVITDHHQVLGEHPPAEAFVNPHRKDATYPFLHLSGVGIAFKLCQGITAEIGYPVDKYQRAFLDLAAFGTIADVMPLLGENRIIAKHGLPLLRNSRKTGVRALLDVSFDGEGELPEIGSVHVGFRLAPRVNAAGRLQDPILALRLLLSDDPLEAAQLAGQLDSINKERKLLQESICAQAMKDAKEAIDSGHKVLVLASQGWHVGVIGVVAGKIADHASRPCFCIAIDDVAGVAKGSARSIPEFDLGESIEHHRSYLLSGGGHAAAAGFSLDPARIDEFRTAMLTYADGFISDEMLLPRGAADVEVDPAELSLQAAADLCRMQPVGEANREAAFLMRGMTVGKTRPTRNPDHANANLTSRNGHTFEAICFQKGPSLCELEGRTADVVVNLDVDRFNGRERLRCNILDFQALDLEERSESEVHSHEQQERQQRNSNAQDPLPL